MIDVSTLVSQTSNELAKQSVQIPTPLLSAFTLFHRVHKVWRSYRRAKIYTNPNNFLSLTAGHIVNYTIGDKLLVRISAVCVLIAKRILSVVSQIEKFQTSYVNLTYALKGQFPSKVKYDTLKPPSIKSEILYRKKKMINRIKRIAISLFVLLKEAFKLSMKMMDAIEAFYLSPSTRNEEIQEIFVNSTKILDKLEKNRTKLSEGLEKNQELIGKILKGINAAIPIETFIDTAEKTIKKVAPKPPSIKSNESRAAKIFRNLPKKWLNDVVKGTFIESLVPWQWRPMPEYEWLELTQSLETNRLPEKTRITKQSIQ